MTTSDSKIAKIQEHFQALSQIAPTLNTASDLLTKAVAILDEALAKLNIGLTVWVPFEDRSDEQNPLGYNVKQIGYCKVNGQWGLALRHIWGREDFDEHNEDGPWLFNDASREMRVLSVDKIPDVVEKLAKEAVNTSKRIQEKTKEVLDLAEAIAPKEVKGKAQTLAERIAAGQKTLTASRKNASVATLIGEMLVPDVTKQGSR